ncbi:MAG: DUF1156 domain-containing protein [Chloroflexi bacterium]|uniref:DUF1156 domain-containing protein n=1 Tax=Candidatus Flexifilum breve TaxID=3140694 RepID=UPI00313666B1|nr:DUF1156 domain-containing protein [Chloroflexota bacterium]
MTTDKRLIEEYIPIKAISAEASREKSIRHGHISTLHLWWARRPLVASRAAVFAALIPADAQPQLIDYETKAPYTLNKFVIDLCKWEVRPEVLDEARRLIREAYPENPPKVLDMFAGGGSIPLEALRLGCEAYALDLNPVAHIIELATLVYPQKYGSKLADDVRKWGEWVLERVRAEVGDLYPLIRDPEIDSLTPQAPLLGEKGSTKQMRMFPSDQAEQLELPEGADEDEEDPLDGTSVDVPFGYVQPVAYLWTRTVTCPNPGCRATVPLVRQTWLKKKKGDNVALAMLPHPSENRMAFYVKKVRDPQEFGFDPAAFSERGNSVCGRCGSTVDSGYIKTEGKAGRMGAQMMATVCVRPGTRGKVYLSPDEQALPVPDEAAIRARIEALTAETGITPPDEPLPEKLTGGMCTIYGLDQFYKLFSFRQLLTLLTITKVIHQAHAALSETFVDAEYARAVSTFLGMMLSRLTDFSSTLSTFNSTGGRGTKNTFARQALPMVWDFSETNPISGVAADWQSSIRAVKKTLPDLLTIGSTPANVSRGSATRFAL